VTLPPRRPDGWLRAALATLGFGLLVAGGIADHGGVLPLLVIGRAAFPEASALAHALAFLLPVLAFLGSVWVRRDVLRRAAEADVPFDHGHLPRMARWLIPVWAVGGFSLSLPLNRLAPFDQGLALLAAMGAIAAIVAVSVRPVVLLLSDLTLITKELSARLRRITVPVVAFPILVL